MKAVFGCLAVLVGVAAGAACAGRDCALGHSVQCHTRYGKASTNSIETKTKTLTEVVTEIRTYTVPETITGPSKTTVSTIYETCTDWTTDSVETDTYTSTSTITATDTATVTEFATDIRIVTYTTTTTEGTTTTIDIASTGWSPVLDTTAGVGARMANNATQRRGTEANLEASREKLHRNKHYPEKVHCVTHELLTTISSTCVASSSVTITPPGTVTDTTTCTVYTTSTVVPNDVSTTLTDTTTSTTTQQTTITDWATVTQSTTLTMTANVAVATAYDICGTDSRNYLGPDVDGQAIVDGYPSVPYSAISVSSAVDCCNACAAGEGDLLCGASYFDTLSKYCYLFNPSTCPYGSSECDWVLGAANGVAAFVVSNGPCGFVQKYAPS